MHIFTYTQVMQKSNICGLSREELHKAGVQRPILSLDEVKAEARRSEVIQVIGHKSTGAMLVVMPGGAVFGTASTWFVDEAESVAALYGAFVTRLDEVVGL